MGIIETVKMLKREEGEAKVKHEIVKNLLLAKQFTNAQIANFTNTTEVFVRKVKKEMSAK